MALTIEDGSGVASADSYQDLAAARQLSINYGVSLPVDDDEAETALRQGYLNLNTHETKLQGCRVYAVQTGIFPRKYVFANGFLVPNDSIPDDIKLAQLYAASAIAGGVDTNAVDDGQALKSFNAVETLYTETYQDGSRVKVNSRIQGVVNSLAPYYKSAVSSGQNYREFEYLV